MAVDIEKLDISGEEPGFDTGFIEALNEAENALGISDFEKTITFKYGLEPKSPEDKIKFEEFSKLFLGKINGWTGNAANQRFKPIINSYTTLEDAMKKVNDLAKSETFNMNPSRIGLIGRSDATELLRMSEAYIALGGSASDFGEEVNQSLQKAKEAIPEYRSSLQDMKMVFEDLSKMEKDFNVNMQSLSKAFPFQKEAYSSDQVQKLVEENKRVITDLYKKYNEQFEDLSNSDIKNLFTSKGILDKIGVNIPDEFEKLTRDLSNFGDIKSNNDTLTINGIPIDQYISEGLDRAETVIREFANTATKVDFGIHDDDIFSFDFDKIRNGVSELDILVKENGQITEGVIDSNKQAFGELMRMVIELQQKYEELANQFRQGIPSEGLQSTISDLYRRIEEAQEEIRNNSGGTYYYGGGGDVYSSDLDKYDKAIERIDASLNELRENIGSVENATSRAGQGLSGNVDKLTGPLNEVKKLLQDIINILGNVSKESPFDSLLSGLELVSRALSDINDRVSNMNFDVHIQQDASLDADQKRLKTQDLLFSKMKSFETAYINLFDRVKSKADFNQEQVFAWLANSPSKYNTEMNAGTYSSRYGLQNIRNIYKDPMERMQAYTELFTLIKDANRVYKEEVENTKAELSNIQKRLNSENMSEDDRYIAEMTAVSLQQSLENLLNKQTVEMSKAIDSTRLPTDISSIRKQVKEINEIDNKKSAKKGLDDVLGAVNKFNKKNANIQGEAQAKAQKKSLEDVVDALGKIEELLKNISNKSFLEDVAKASEEQLDLVSSKLKTIFDQIKEINNLPAILPTDENSANGQNTGIVNIISSNTNILSQMTNAASEYEQSMNKAAEASSGFKRTAASQEVIKNNIKETNALIEEQLKLENTQSANSIKGDLKGKIKVSDLDFEEIETPLERISRLLSEISNQEFLTKLKDSGIENIQLIINELDILDLRIKELCEKYENGLFANVIPDDLANKLSEATSKATEVPKNELDALYLLQERLTKIIGAIKKKNELFEAEATIVKNAVNSEKGDLNGLISFVKGINDQIAKSMQNLGKETVNASVRQNKNQAKQEEQNNLAADRQRAIELNEKLIASDKEALAVLKEKGAEFRKTNDYIEYQKELDVLLNKEGVKNSEVNATLRERNKIQKEYSSIVDKNNRAIEKSIENQKKAEEATRQAEAEARAKQNEQTKNTIRSRMNSDVDPKIVRFNQLSAKLKSAENRLKQGAPTTINVESYQKWLAEIKALGYNSEVVAGNYKRVAAEVQRSVQSSEEFLNAQKEAEEATRKAAEEARQAAEEERKVAEATKAAEAASKSENDRIKEREKLLTKISKLNANISKTYERNSAYSNEAISKLRGYIEELRTMSNMDLGISVEDMEKISSRLKEITIGFNNIQASEAAAGRSGRSFFGNMTNQLSHLNAQFIAMYFSWMDWIRYTRQGLNTIVELDSALAEMNKVSNETMGTLKNFQKASYDIADGIATTGLELQKSTADWMRLGKNIQSATEYAKAANILLKVSEFSDISDATESLVSITEAYKDLPVMDIIDEINNIGNNYQISTQEISEGLQNVSGVLATSNNSIEEAIALITAGNAIDQDVSKASRGVRMIALRITGTEEAKEQLEELGEDTSDFIVQTQSKMRNLIMNYTKAAGNAYKGVDILDENGNYKSTYQILLEIARVYDQILEDDKKFGTNRGQALIEAIAGNRFACTHLIALVA